MNNKNYHLFVGSLTVYGAYNYVDSFVELDDAYQAFLEMDTSAGGYIMQNAAGGSLIRTHDINERDLSVFPERPRYSLVELMGKGT
ncbi:hypothetical protein LCGC14_1295500 [marine sediment metagenome]|uniref:Uncharacterized protein n=1 Tax=marine sediment metagenome TaxID=412755 RepID=A0A0F9KRG8_9ZZZZ